MFMGCLGTGWSNLLQGLALRELLILHEYDNAELLRKSG